MARRRTRKYFEAYRRYSAVIPMQDWSTPVDTSIDRWIADGKPNLNDWYLARYREKSVYEGAYNAAREYVRKALIHAFMLDAKL